jgi:transposase
MKRTRQRYDRAFKISVVAELESGKPPSQIAREHSIHPSLALRWRDEMAENPEKAFSGNGIKYKAQARIAELEKLLGQAHAEIELLKKAFTMTQKKAREKRTKLTLQDGI